MSYDLGIWYHNEKLAVLEPRKIYQQLCDGQIDVVIPHDAINDFYTELTRMHPEIDSVPDEEIDNLDICPWSNAFDRSLGHLIINCVWPKGDYVKKLLLKLAAKYSLAVFDPQSGILHLPQ